VKLLVSVFLVALPFAAAAHSPEDVDPAMAPWFRSLQQEDSGGSCCNEQDCHTVDLGRDLRIEDGKYLIRDEEGGWLPVPPMQILHRYDNPTGKYVACIYQHRVLCFVQAAGG
jgi:hypothetical protein